MEEDNMKFYDEEHKLFYKGKVAELENLKCNNSYYRALVYALSLSPETRKNFAKIFDVQNKKFNTVSCTKCGYTELYRGETDDLMNVIDFLFG